MKLNWPARVAGTAAFLFSTGLLPPEGAAELRSASAPVTVREQHQIAAALESSMRELSRILNYRPAQAPEIQLVRSADAVSVLGKNVPALFHQGVIYLVIDPLEPQRLIRAKRSVRHEAMHAAIAEITGGNCPAWVEEGMAQIFEGTAAGHHAGSAESRSTVAASFSALESNFALLPPGQIAPAYAQSRFAVQTLINRYGMPKVREYLLRLQSTPHPEAFAATFAVTLDNFEVQASRQFSRAPFAS